MKIVARLFSGLGNQLFQYAAGLYYAKRSGAQIEFSIDGEGANSFGYPRPFLLSHFSITSPFHELTALERLVLTRREKLKLPMTALKRMLGIQVVTEDPTLYYTFLQDLPAHRLALTIYLVGYWQAYRIAEEIEDELRMELRLREPARDRNLEVLQQIRRASCPVSLHIRRGDYLLESEGSKALPIDYYRHAIQFFKDRFARPTFFVFSDDMEFARQCLPRDAQLVFVDHNDSFSAHEDLRLMSSCNDHIIANSSFSWWGAWLNPRSDKFVFAPSHWHLKPSSYFPRLVAAELDGRKSA